MQGLMMDSPLLVSSVIRFAAETYGDTPIISRTVEGPLHRYDYQSAHGRMQQLANALRRLGIGRGDRVATVAWNGYRHFELYYAISGIGAVCHTINPRLFAEQLVYIVNHAEDQYICLDVTFVPLLEALAEQLKPVKGYIVMADAANMPETSLPKVFCYEELLAAEPDHFDWPVFDETSACSLCYTSGTTGNPKGVAFTHRSNMIHTFSVMTTAGCGIDANSVVLPVVPLFHANAWGLPYVVALAGASFVFPGSKLDGASVYDLMEAEQVTSAWGVPTVWLGLLNEVRRRNARFTHLKTVLIGGSAAPRAMIESFENDYDVEVIHGWGMTEMSPVGTTGKLNRRIQSADAATRHAIKSKQGRVIFGVEMKIVDPEGRDLPRDGVAFGELLVRGPTITGGYYNDAMANENAFDKDGWFRTGDVATIDAEGYLHIVDRTKDVIKSGGEWISSIDLENAAVGHPQIAEAAVIGLPHPKWDERPLLVVVPTSTNAVSAEEIREFLASRVAKWWLPDDILFVDELPHTATGKILKTALREQFKDHILSTATG